MWALIKNCHFALTIFNIYFFEYYWMFNKLTRWTKQIVCMFFLNEIHKNRTISISHYSSFWINKYCAYIFELKFKTYTFSEKNAFYKIPDWSACYITFKKQLLFPNAFSFLTRSVKWFLYLSKILITSLPINLVFFFNRNTIFTINLIYLLFSQTCNLFIIMWFIQSYILI